MIEKEITITMTLEHAEQLAATCTFRINHDGQLTGPQQKVITGIRTILGNRIDKARSELVMAGMQARCPSCEDEG